MYHWHGGRITPEALDERTRHQQRISDDHEERLRKVETRLQRGAILLFLMGSGVAGNMSADQIAELVVRLLKGG